uniref:Fibronectin n=1 Tax=Amphimedon queenslandica TaxID=400682 RepID=A0A1X7TMZ0_AMPQE
MLVPSTALSSLTEVNKTATTITVSWTALHSSDADGYVVNVTSDTDTVQTVQVEGSSNNTITLNGLRELTTYSITVRAYQQLLGPASSAISVFTNCQQEGIYLGYNQNCYPNRSYFWDSSVNLVTKAISCVLPGTSLTTGQWVRVADPDDPVDCNINNASDPFRCTSVTSPDATLNLYLAQGLPAAHEGWYKCCLPTDCSDPSTNIIFANIFRFAEIESFTIAELPSDMTVYPQEYKLNCVKIGFHQYVISMSIGNTAVTNYSGSCSDVGNTCSGTVLVSSTNTVRYTVDITWNGTTVSSGLISQSTAGDQMYQCVVQVSDQPTRTRSVTVKVPSTAPSSLTEVNKTATTITVNWTALHSSDADGYVVNVTSDTDTVQTIQVEGSNNNTIALNGLRGGTTYSITIRAYQQLLGPANSTISVQTLPVIELINWTLVSFITQLNSTQYCITCLTTTDINPSTDVYWLVNGVMKNNSMYTSIDVLTYNNTLLVYPDPLGVSVNVTCIAIIGGVNYSQSVILHAPNGPPNNVKGFVLNDTSIKVNWTNSSETNGYVIEYTSGGVTRNVVSISEDEIVLTNLSSKSTYTISVYSYIDLPSVNSTVALLKFDGIYLRHNGNCYTNGSYFPDNIIRPTPLECGLPGATLNGGQWVGPDGIVPCDGGNIQNVQCTTGSGAMLSVHINPDNGFLQPPGDGWYKCCLPTDCSDPNTNIMFANIFNFAQIESFTVADLPSDMTVYPQKYKLNCTKIGFHQYNIRMSIGNTALTDDPGSCNDFGNTCSGTVLASSTHTIRYTVDITWDGMTVSSESISQSTTGDQMYQCKVHVANQPIRTRSVTIKVPATTPSSLTEVSKTATTITVSWTALDSSDADGYVVNVTSNTDTVQTVQVEGSSNNTITLNGLRGGTTYSITVRAYQQLLGPASNTISVFTLSICLAYNGVCYPNGSYFWDSSIRPTPLECVLLPGATLNGGQWIGPNGTVPCDGGNNQNVQCTAGSGANLSVHINPDNGHLLPPGEGWYKCCLPTDCSDPNTKIIFANIFRFAQIESFNVADLPSDMTVYPQKYKLNCIKIGFYQYNIRMSISNTALSSYTGCTDNSNSNPCSGTVLVSSTNTIRYTIDITWDGMTVSSGSISQSTTGDQMYQCKVQVTDQPTRIRNTFIQVPNAAPSSLTDINNTATTITVSWTALDSSHANGYVVNVTSDTGTVQTVQVEGNSNNTITLNGLRGEIIYSITVRAYQQLLGPASSRISVQTLPIINSINWTLFSSITQLNNTQYHIDCLATTDINPSTDVYWLVNGVMKSNSMYTSIDLLTYNNTILVYPDPLGVSVNATCIAMIGGVNYSQSMILHAPSGPPNYVKGFILNATSIKVNWTNSSEANGYVIEYTTGGVTRNVLSTSEDEIVLTNLSSMSTYTISVYSYTDLPSVNSTVTVLKFDVPSPVTSLSVSNVSTTGITVNWTIPSSDNYVAYYTISYTPSCPQLSSVNETVSVVAHEYTTTYSYTLIGLYIGMNYTITVRAWNVLGASNYTSVKKHAIFLKAPTGVPTSLSLLQPINNLTWNEVNCSERNGLITGYTVMISNSGVTYNLTSTERYIILNDLVFGTEYNISVAAVNSAGRGPFSDPTIVEIGMVPGPVGSASSIMDTTWAIISWSVPSYIPSDYPIITYEIGYHALESGNCSMVYDDDINPQVLNLFNVSSNDTFTTITGLNSNTCYIFGIRPYSDNGYGEWTVTTNETLELLTESSSILMSPSSAQILLFTIASSSTTKQFLSTVISPSSTVKSLSSSVIQTSDTSFIVTVGGSGVATEKRLHLSVVDKMTVSGLVFVSAVFLLSVSEVISQCPPSSDNTIRGKPLECGLPGANLDDGQWIGPDGEVPCPGNKQNVQCTPGSSGANLSVQIPNHLQSSDGDGWYKCCLPTDCSDSNTSIIVANIFNFAQIESFTVADLPSDMTVYPQEYKLNCIKIGFNRYDISMSINNTALASYTNCDDNNNNPCPGTDLSGVVENTVRYTVTITWDGMNVSSGSISQSTTGDQMYQCVVQVTDQRTRTRSLTVTVPANAPSSFTVVSKTATTINVSWTALDSSDADGYVVNVTSDTDTVQTVQVKGSNTNAITLNGLRELTTYNITVRAYQQLLGPASTIKVQTSPVINSINWTLVSSITQLNSTQYRITCITTTDINPSTDVYWLVNGVMKSNSMYTSIDVLTYNNTLLVYPDPLGVSVTVTCTAMIGGVNYSQSVTLHAPNGPPNNVKGFILNATSIKVNWTNSSEVIRYVIEYTTESVTRNVVSTSKNEIVLTDLLLMSTYTISVYSYIDLPSVNSTVTVLRFDVPSPVTSLSVSNVSTTCITVNWTIPSSDNYVTYYTISYTPSCPQLSSVNETVSVVPHQSTTTYSYTLIGLYSGMNYTITVRAGNVLGGSDPSSIKKDTMPTAPTGVSTSLSLLQPINNLTWNEVNCSKHDGLITGYTVMISNSSITYNLTSTERYIILNDLAFGTKYNISVAAVNSAGRGPFSDPIIVEIGMVPSPVGSVSSIVDTTWAVISWSKPIYIPSDYPIITYEIGYHALESGNCSMAYDDDITPEILNLSNVSSNDTFTIITGLNSNTCYIFGIRAYSDNGYGAWTVITNETLELLTESSSMLISPLSMIKPSSILISPSSAQISLFTIASSSSTKQLFSTVISPSSTLKSLSSSTTKDWRRTSSGTL